MKRLALITILFLSIVALSQPDLPNLENRPCQSPPCNPAPIDGEGYLVISAIMLGTLYLLTRKANIVSFTNSNK